jgi:hypothetical protein
MITIDFAELSALVQQPAFLIGFAVGATLWAIRELYGMRDRKRLRLMDDLNLKIIRKLDPNAMIHMTKREINDKLVRILSHQADQAIQTLPPPPDFPLPPGTQMAPGGQKFDNVLDALKNLDSTKQVAENTLANGTATGAVIVLPVSAVGGFLSHIEIDGFKGIQGPGPTPDMVCVKVPIKAADEMGPLTKSIARWEEMRKNSHEQN